MYSVTYEIGLFGAEVSPDVLAQAIEAMAMSLYQIDLLCLQYMPGLPPLYRSGVRYVQEEKGAERWMDIPRVLELKRGDCEDLASWRAAELTMAGIPSRPVVSYQVHGNEILFHVQTRTPFGIEDPSRVLGMP